MVLVMKTTLIAHLSLGPYKESVKSVQIQMPFHAVGRSFRPSGGSYAPGIAYIDHIMTYMLQQMTFVLESERENTCIDIVCMLIYIYLWCVCMYVCMWTRGVYILTLEGRREEELLASLYVLSDLPS